MKKILVFLTAVLFLMACNAKPTAKEATKPAPAQKKNVLVAYFSATGTTKKVAQNLAQITKGDIYEIKPLTLYTSEDLDWTNPNSRTSLEMKDQTSRPGIVPENLSLKDYDTIYLGFPIWWGTAPTIVRTFLEKQDFSNKKVIIFVTSGTSGIGNVDQDLKSSISSSAIIIKGKALNGNPSVEELTEWVKTLE